MLRGVLLALVLALLFVARRARADEGVSIALDPAAPLAPSDVTIVAEPATPDLVFVGYDWGALETWPRCRGERCVVPTPIASCRNVSLAATTDLGEVHTATRAVCVTDGDGEPPRATLRVSSGDGGTFVVEPQVEAGSSPVVLTRAWLDARELTNPAASLVLEPDRGCHVADLFALDQVGRAALDHRTVCFSADAPRVWLGAASGAFPEVGTSVATCAEAVHPLGLELTRTVGDGPLDACRSPRVIAPGVTREVIAADDDRGVRSFASMTFVATSRGSTRLFFASIPRRVSGTVGGAVSVAVELVGGAEPFRVAATLAGGGTVRVPSMPVGRDAVMVLLDDLGPVGAHALAVTVTDARGASATVTTEVEVYPRDDVPEPNAKLAACTAAHGARSDALGMSLLVFIALFAARRGAR